jgi:hypothetical protein
MPATIPGAIKAVETYCAGECRPGPAKREDDAEGFIEKSTERPVAAEQQQQQATGHDRRHHERQMNHAVEQALAVKSPARQNDCRCQPKGQAADHCPERDAQAQPHRLNFGRTDIELQAHPTVTGTRCIARKGPSG